MITSNHKKLVNGCYPIAVKNKNLSSISPDPNSLSKLIYYCSTRPHKIQKITTYLISYAQSQALPSSFTSSFSVYRHSKPGLICTIKIFNALLGNPTINLRILGPHLSTIIAIGLGLFNQSFSSSPLVQTPSTTTTTTTTTQTSSTTDSGYFGSDWVSQDLDITRATIDLFSTYAQSIRPDCLQDEQLARNYLFFLAKFSSVAILCPPTSSLIQSHTTDHQSTITPKPARCMALMALESTVKAPGLYSSPYFERQLRMILPGLMSSIIPSPHRPPDELITLIHQACLDCSDQTPRSPTEKNQLVQEISDFRSIITPVSPPETSKSTEIDLIKFSIKSLTFLLSVQLTNLNQFERCVNEMLNQIESTISTIGSRAYYDWFGKSLLHWAMAKYRSSVIDLVVDRLTLIDSKQQKSKSKSTTTATLSHELHLQKMIIMAGMLNAMITDPLASSIQLLNTLNILHQLLRLIQSILELNQPTQDSQRLRDLLVELIGSLARTVYYDEQINDMCKDILGNIKLIVQPKPSESTQDGPCSSFEPAFVVALFDSLERIIVNTNTHSSTNPSSRSEHLPVGLPLWKDSLSILADLQDPQCRLASFRALLSFLKYEAFHPLQTSKPGADQHLLQFLSAFNVCLFREFMSNSSINSATNSLPFPDQTVHSNTTSSSEVDHKIAPSEPPHGTLQSGPKATNITVVNGGSNSRSTEPGLYECLLEILGHQEYLILSVCLPMLREMDQVMMMSVTLESRRENSGNQSIPETAVDNHRPLSPSGGGHPLIKHKDFVLDCLMMIAKVWQLDELSTTLGKSSSSYEDDQPDQTPNIQDGDRITRQIDWDSLVKAVCNSPLVQQKSGLDRATLEAHFLSHQWSLIEARTVAGWMVGTATRRGSMASNSASNRVHHRQRVGSAVGVNNETGIIRARLASSGQQSIRKGYLSNLLNRSPNGSLSTILQSPSVSDLRNSLLGTGFFHPNPAGLNGPSSISGRSSLLLNHHTELAHSAVLNNHSTGDLARYILASNPSTTHTNTTTTSSRTNADSTLAMNQRSFFNPLTDLTTRRTTSNTTDPSSPTSHTHQQPSGRSLHQEQRGVSKQKNPVSLARRQTLTAEVLAKVRSKTSADHHRYPSSASGSPNLFVGRPPSNNGDEGGDYVQFIRKRSQMKPFIDQQQQKTLDQPGHSPLLSSSSNGMIPSKTGVGADGSGSSLGVRLPSAARSPLGPSSVTNDPPHGDHTAAKVGPDSALNRPS
ncbi:hypothetical protein PGT21_017117 [Puccinia graminis f. sp. tritici]|uniref:Plasma membrane localization protein n=1 Tax=Puccinia graminis f. sp. tritici TaxID=56615 RepID=A0A5B0PI69_PUCGR|nr:hypothetical protein PGT21_017117 [Puccinia graminis f. sp. tritici]